MVKPKPSYRPGCAPDDSHRHATASGPPARGRRKSGALPWMPVDIGDHLADHAQLTTEQHGAFFLLVMYQWRRGAIPAVPSDLAQICRCTVPVWLRRLAPALLPLFERRGDVLIEPSYEFQRDKAHAISDERRDAAAKKWRRAKHQAGGGEPNKNNDNTDASAGGLHTPRTARPTPPQAQPGVQPQEDRASSPPMQVPQVLAVVEPRRGAAPDVPVQPHLAMGPMLVQLPLSSLRDARAALFRDGLAALVRMTGLMEKRARSLLGKLLKQSKDDCVGLLAILREAERDQPADPVSWIVKCVEHRVAPKAVRGVLGSLVAERRAEADAEMRVLTIDADPVVPPDPFADLDRMLAHG